MTINFEFVRKDENFQDAKIYKFEALHVTTTKNSRKYTLREMELGARSLSFRPLNRNHDHSRFLAHPENSILVTDFDKIKMAVVGEMRIADTEVITLIESGKIKKLSIEQIPTQGEDCSTNVCEQKGVVFTAMALLDIGVTPGDEKAEIKTESIEDACLKESCECRIDSVVKESLKSFPELNKETRYKICSEILSPMTKDEAWKLYNMTNIENLDSSMVACLENMQRDFPEMPMDQRVASCMEILGRVKAEPKPQTITVGITPQEAWKEYNKK